MAEAMQATLTEYRSNLVLANPIYEDRQVVLAAVDFAADYQMYLHFLEVRPKKGDAEKVELEVYANKDSSNLAIASWMIQEDSL